MDKDSEPLVGGSYLVKDGVRTLIEEPTQDHPAGNCARDADGTPVVLPVPTEAPAAEAAAPAERKARKGANRCSSA